MIDQILPAAVIAVEVHEDAPEAPLFPEEQAAVRRAVGKRQREFATARACAHAALERLDLPQHAVPVGPRGEPRWPPGVVGSITHCDGYRACAVGRLADVLTIGIDAEPCAPLPDGVLDDIAGPEEKRSLHELARTLPEVSWDRLLFSAKEAVYKAWFPLAQRWLGFDDALVTIQPSQSTFSASLLVDGPVVQGQQLTEFSGRWLAAEGLVLTAVALPNYRENASLPAPGDRPWKVVP